MKIVDNNDRNQKIVSLAAERQARATSAEAVWGRFIEAQQRSKETLDIADGIEAGKAYAEWLELFTRRA